MTLLALGITGCASTPPSDPRDPWEAWNRGVQTINDTIDDYAMKPVANGYRWIVPTFVDRGVTNFYNNIDDIAVIANDLLQLKLAQTGKDSLRFLSNTALGMGGLFDVASQLELPKHHEDLDQTLGFWGIPTGPYMVVPFLGPSTPRGLVGLAGGIVSNPINWIMPIAIPFASGALSAVDERADLLSASKIADEASVDRYEFIRNAYLEQRNYLVYDGNPPPDTELQKEMDLELNPLDNELDKATNEPAPVDSGVP